MSKNVLVWNVFDTKEQIQILCSWDYLKQSPKNLLGVSAFPTGKFLRVHKVFVCIYKVDHKIDINIRMNKIKKCPRLSGKFLRNVESFQPVWKVSSQTASKVCHGKHGMYTKGIHALLAHLCRKSYLRAVIAKNDLRALSGKYLRVISCQQESFEFLSLQLNVAL